MQRFLVSSVGHPSRIPFSGSNKPLLLVRDAEAQLRTLKFTPVPSLGPVPGQVAPVNGASESSCPASSAFWPSPLATGNWPLPHLAQTPVTLVLKHCYSGARPFSLVPAFRRSRLLYSHVLILILSSTSPHTIEPAFFPSRYFFIRVSGAGF